MQQLYGPLNFFGTYYRVIQQSMIDMESMFELLERQPGLRDQPGAKDLVVTDHEIVFDNVSFAVGFFGWDGGMRDGRVCSGWVAGRGYYSESSWCITLSIL